jgi:hypothetical protein
MDTQNMDRRIFRLDDSVIAQIVKLVQVGLMTGTDISDHFRLLVLEPSEGAGTLVLTPEYMEKDAKDVEAMFDHLEDMMSMDDDSETSLH